MSVAQRLKKLRKEKNLTQEQLAQELGLSKSAVIGYENGKREPNFEAMTKLEKFFGVSASYLRGEDENTDYKETQDELLDTLAMLISGLECTSDFLKKLPQEEQLEAYTFIDNCVSLLMNKSVDEENMLDYLDSLNGLLGNIQRFRQLLEQAIKNKANFDVSRMAEKYSREYYKNLYRLAEIYGFEHFDNNKKLGNDCLKEYSSELSEPPIAAVKEEEVAYLPVFNLRMLDESKQSIGRVNRYLDENTLTPVPIKGEAAAGIPIEIFEDDQGCLLVNQKHSRYNSFAVRVRGNSMLGANIHPGDYAVIRPQPTVENGEIALVNVEGDVTIKFFYKINEGYELRSANPDYQPMVYDSNSKLRIIGKVVDVIRNESCINTGHDNGLLKKTESSTSAHGKETAKGKNSA